METILHLLPLTPDEQDRFRAAAPNEEHLFLPTSDRRGAAAIPQDWRERTTILMGFVPPEDLKRFPKLKWVQSWNAGVDPYLAPGVLPEGVVLTCAAGACTSEGRGIAFCPRHMPRGSKAVSSGTRRLISPVNGIFFVKVVTFTPNIPFVSIYGSNEYSRYRL